MLSIALSQHTLPQWLDGSTHQALAFVMNTWAVYTLSRISNLLKGPTQLGQNTKLLGVYSFCRFCSFFYFFVHGQGSALENLELKT